MARGLTEEQMAECAELNPRTVQKIEAGAITLLVTTLVACAPSPAATGNGCSGERVLEAAATRVSCPCRRSQARVTVSGVITIHGIYLQGSVVLDYPVNLPDGAQVKVTLVPEAGAAVSRDETHDRLSDGRSWPQTPAEMAAFLAEMDATPGLEISDEEYAQMETERQARKAQGIADNEARMARLSALAP